MTEESTSAQPARTYFAEERKQIIMEILNQQHKISIPELCVRFNTSPVTIRSDLNALQQSGLLKRTHGGAILNKQVSEESFFSCNVPHQREKRKLAEYALTMIDDGDTILLDTGTTAMELARLLNAKQRLTIVLNDLQIAAHLEQNTTATIIMLGGIVRRGLHCTVGPSAVQMLNAIKVDKAFLGTNGISLDGLSTPDVYQADIKQRMMQIANHVIVMADSSKLGTTAFQRFARTLDYDTLLTNADADPEFIAKLRESGIDIILVA